MREWRAVANSKARNEHTLLFELLAKVYAEEYYKPKV
jgi:hypothetical protein